MTLSDVVNSIITDKATNCRCVLLPPKPKLDENSAKFYGGLLLCDISKKIRIPTEEEWIGINLLERDDELRRM